MGWFARRRERKRALAARGNKSYSGRSSGSVAVPSRQRVRELLEETPFGFLNESLSDSVKKWKRFCKNFEFESHREDTEILSHTQVSRSLYIILDGEVSVSFPDEKDDSQLRVLCTKTRGDTFGSSRFSRGSKGKKGADTSCGDDKNAASCCGITVKVVSDDCSVVRLNDVALTRYLNKYPGEKESIEKILSFSATDALRKVPWLEGVAEQYLTYFAHMLHFQSLQANQKLFEEGSLGRAMYFVSHGVVRASTFDAKEKKEKLLREFLPGDNFGEISFACNMPRTSDIIASQKALVLKLEKDDCENFFRLFTINRDPWTDMLKKRTAESFRRYKVPFFEAITDDQYEILASLCSIERLAPSTVIFSEGDAGDTFYIVAHGDLEATVMHETKKLVLGQIGPGQYFGEIALVSNQCRSATVTTKSRCVLLKITKAQFDEFFEKAPEANSDFQMKLSGYHVELKVLLYHRDGVKYFEEHLKKEYSQENIHFWKACRQYEQMSEEDEKAIHEEARQISKMYIEDSAEEQVNLPETMKARILADIATCKVDLSTFDRARDEILHLMSSDSFQRFKQSKLFQELLEIIGDMSYKSKDQAIRASVDIRDSPSERRHSIRKSFLDFSLQGFSRPDESSGEK